MDLTTTGRWWCWINDGALMDHLELNSLQLQKKFQQQSLDQH